MGRHLLDGTSVSGLAKLTPFSIFNVVAKRGSSLYSKGLKRPLLRNLARDIVLANKKR
jgi:hypothetical protein